MPAQLDTAILDSPSGQKTPSNSHVSFCRSCRSQAGVSSGLLYCGVKEVLRRWKVPLWLALMSGRASRQI